MKRYLACAGALSALAGSAHAASTDSTDDSLTWHAITLDRTVEIGYTYQNRRTPLNDYSIGPSEAVAGSGDPQDAPLDSSLKYINQIGIFGHGTPLQSGASTGSGGNATELNLGCDFFPGLSVGGLGAKYSFSRSFDLIGAWYPYNENKYIATAKCPGGTRDSGACSGRLDAYSLVAAYQFDRRLNACTGFMWSHVADGLAAGYLNRWTIDPTIGARFNLYALASSDQSKLPGATNARPARIPPVNSVTIDDSVRCAARW